MNQQKGFSIRQKKVEKMVMDKLKEEERALSVEYKAREIPSHVKSNKFEQMEDERKKRMDDNKKFAMAKIKATEKPFTFYKRDVKVQKSAEEMAELPEDVP
jgi:GTPase